MDEESGRLEPELDRERERIRARLLAQAALSTRERYRFTLISTGATLAAAVGALGSVVLLFAANSDRQDIGPLLAGATSTKSEQQLDAQRKQIEKIRLQYEEIMNRASSSALPRPPEVVALSRRLDAIEAEQSRLSAIISESPEKAVAIPLLRRDIDDVKDNQTQVADALKREIDRVYDLNKWIIGGLAVGVLGILVRDIFRERASAKSL